MLSFSACYHLYCTLYCFVILVDELLFREGFRFRLENIVRGQASSHPETSANNVNIESRDDQNNTNASQEVPNGNQVIGIQLPDRTGNMDQSPAAQITLHHATPDQRRNWQGQIAEDERTDAQQSSYNDSIRHRHGNPDSQGWIRLDNSVSNWPSASAATDDGGQHRSPESHEVWPDDGSREAVDNWSEGPSDPPRMRRSVPSRRGTRFYPPDDDNVYSMELRELLSRLLPHIVCFSIFSFF